MTDDNSNIGLSRRRLLGGIGAIGVASAGAGLGTTAYFSDQEGFEGNTLTAGTLALIVEQELTGIDQDGIGPDEAAWYEAGDGEAVVTDQIVVTDAKPGDEYEICWTVEIEGNPAFAKVTLDADEQTGAEAGTVSAVDLYDVDDDDDMVTIGEAADAVAALTLSDGSEVVIYENSLAGLFDALSEGIPVPARSDDGVEEYCHEPGEAVELCVTITIPTTVGNELQGATSTFDVEVYAEQCRHNDLETFMGQTEDVRPA